MILAQSAPTLPQIFNVEGVVETLIQRASENYALTAVVGVGFFVAFAVLGRGIEWVNQFDQKRMAQEAENRLYRRRGMRRKDGTWTERAFEEMTRIDMARNQGRLRRTRRGRVRYE